MNTEKELLIRIASKRGLSIDYVGQVLSRKLLTVAQLRDLTGLSEGAIHNKTYKRVRRNKPILSLRYPYPSKKGNGPSFIINDDECKRLIEERNK
jgi:hypothetical protein